MLEIINKTKFYNIEELRSLSEEEILEMVAAADVPSLEDGIKPFMVITGLPGSGKSYFGAKLSERYGKDIVSTDSYFLSMRKAWLEGKSHPYIDLFCRKYEREIVENSLDINIVNPPSYYNN